MAARECRGCARPTKYLRPETGYLCKVCRPAARVCEDCGVDIFGRNSRATRCVACAEAHRAKYRKRRKRGVESWQRAVRAGFIGAYPDWTGGNCPALQWLQGQRVRIIPLERQRKFPVQYYSMSDAEQYAWRYDNDPTFRERERMRATMRRWLDTKYAVRSASGMGGKRYHDRRDQQLGKVTRRYIKGELVARRCSYCLGELTADNRQLDHVIPTSAGGMHDDSNIVASCQSCNASKGRKPLLMWIMGGGVERREAA